MSDQVVKCPVCGAEIPVISTTGRKPLNIPVNKVCDTVKNSPSIAAAAQELGCSRGYIYKVLENAPRKAAKADIKQA